jgi:methyl-accepting chemotaxis protein
MNATVSAIAEISGVISAINGISTSIASAVEEQSATSGEIMRHAQEASERSLEISSNIESVSTGAEAAMREAGEVLNSAEMLRAMAEELDVLMKKFHCERTSGPTDGVRSGPMVVGATQGEESTHPHYAHQA